MNMNHRLNVAIGMGVLVLSLTLGCALRGGNPVGIPQKPTSKVENVPLVNCYYYAPHNHSLLMRHIEYDLANMVRMGVDVVSLCVQEDQLTNWHQQRLKNFVQRAHQYGLNVHAVPNRWAGMTAGWLDGFSNWSVENRDTHYTDPKYKGRPYSNPAHPKVTEHYRKYIKLLAEAGFDGIIWDEPRPFDRTEIFYFLDEMSACAKSLKPDIVISMFAESSCLHLKDTFPELQHMDYLGSDGHIRSRDHKMHRMKTTIFEAHEAFYEPLKTAGKKTFFLLEAQRHRDADLQNYLDNLEEAFSLPMDHLMFYYSAHEMSYELEDRFNAATWKAVAGLKGLGYKEQALPLR